MNNVSASSKVLGKITRKDKNGKLQKVLVKEWKYTAKKGVKVSKIEEMINKLHTLAEQLEQYTSSEAYTEAERNSIFTPIDMLFDAIEQLDL
mgnify:CR=1 FL=1